MRVQLKNENGIASMNAQFIGEAMYLSKHQIRRAKRALGVKTKANSDGVGDSSFEWVRNIKGRGFNGALFRRNLNLVAS